MTTIRLATFADDEAIAALWSARDAEPTSWFTAAMTAEQVAQRTGEGGTFHVALDEGSLAGFVLSMGIGRNVQLSGSATSETAFYRLLAAVADYWLSREASLAFIVCPAAGSMEKTWLAALGVFHFVTMAVDPIHRNPLVFLVTANLNEVQAAAAAAGGQP